ncbi:MAG: site-specific DNA-methyltransferase [Spirochaetaceae bacterium]|nr:site-specific DNA-methyltransferase [Spirochaetaceae bacterium]
MELYYTGKKTVCEILNHTIAANVKGDIITKNLLIKGDNFSVMQNLRKLYSGKIDLIYIDPPFATNQAFTMGTERVSTISKSKNDTVAYQDNLTGSAYLEFIRERLILAKELLSDVGSIYLHIDYKIGHYIKILMDEIFGVDNFRNDITRIKCNPKNFSRKAYGNIKDMILFYSKTKNIIWHEPKTPFTEGDKEKLFKKIDKDGRAYTTIPLHAPGETKDGATAGVFKGLKPPTGRHWRCSPAELEKLDEEGLIEWSASGNPRKIIYADEREGKKMQDIWEYKDPSYPNYPTEKNLDLLKLIITASSHKNSIVLDFFCGSGTTLVTAEELGRNWIGIDQSEEAIKIVKKKLNDREKELFSRLEYSYLEFNERSVSIASLTQEIA